MLKYLLRGLGALLVRDAAGSAVLLSSRALYFITIHIRFSQLFYGSGLTLITGTDVLSGKTLLIYTYMLNGSEHIKLCTIAAGANNPDSIEELFINAT